MELVVRNPTATARRVRVGNLLDGPLWPPRSRGVPEAGWDDGGFEGVVTAEDRRALGYASPVADDDATESVQSDGPPAEIVWTERAGESEGGDDTSFTAETTPEGVVRSLGDHRPPADAVPTPRSGDTVSTPASVQSEPDPRRSP